MNVHRGDLTEGYDRQVMTEETTFKENSIIQTPGSVTGGSD